MTMATTAATAPINIHFVLPLQIETLGCVGVAEISLGIGWYREVCCNTNVFAQCLWENQLWDNMGNSTNITGDNLGLGGVAFAVGLYH